MGPQGAKNRYEGLAKTQRGFVKLPQKALLLFGDPGFIFKKDFMQLRLCSTYTFNIDIHFIRMGSQGAKNRYEGLANHQKGFAKLPQKALLLFGDPGFSS